MATHEEEFSQRSLVVGRLMGLRSFTVTAEGYLQAPIQDYIFDPGVNEAHCTQEFLKKNYERVNALLALLGEGPLPSTPPLDHQVAGKNCTCGFYAYNDLGYNSFHNRWEGIMGIIACSGLVTVGERGCRAEKAEVVALVHKPLPPSLISLNRTLTQVARALPRAAYWLFLGLINVLIIFFFFMGWDLLVLPVALPLLLGLTVLGGFRRKHRTFFELLFPILHLEERVSLLRERYPQVQWFPTVEAALKVHDLTPPIQGPPPQEGVPSGQA